MHGLDVFDLKDLFNGDVFIEWMKLILFTNL